MGSLLNRAGWTVTVSSVHEDNVGARAIDGDVSTYWHSNASVNYPHTIDIDMGSSQAFTRLIYKPAHERPATVEVYVSSDGLDWGSAIYSGSCVNDANEKIFRLPAQNSRYVRFKGVTGYSMYMTVAEINLGNYPELDAADIVDALPHDLTSNASHSPVVLTNSSVVAPFDAWYCFNRESDSERFVGNTGGAAEIAVDTGLTGADRIIPKFYRVQAFFNATPAERAPKAWTFQGSDNGTDWTTLSTVTNQTTWARAEIREFVCTDLETPYRHYRWVFTENNGDVDYLEIQELWLFGVLGYTEPSSSQPVVIIIC